MFLGYILHSIRLKKLCVYVVGLITCFCTLQVFYMLFPYYFALEEYPILLWWTPFIEENEKIIQCSSSKYTCLLTKERSKINDENLKAILFYGSNVELTDLPIPKTMKWAVFHEESPRNKAFFLYVGTFEVFDIISTFSRNSDLPLTLQYLQNLSTITDKKYVIQVEEKNKFFSIAPVLYIQSDCDTPIDRDAYVSELMKYIQVDSYGACLNNKKFPEEISKIHPLDLYNEKLLKFVAKYKFVVAFENGICEDYITEKLWRPLMVGSIPIYMGSPSVQDWLPNEKSAILVQNYKNPEELAQYIRRVNENNHLYNIYLEHKFGKVSNKLLTDTLARGPFGIQTEHVHPIPAFECYVCQRIHQDLSKQRTKSLYNCDKPKEGNSWEYYWQNGNCQSQALVNSVTDGVKLEADPCG